MKLLKNITILILLSWLCMSMSCGCGGDDYGDEVPELVVSKVYVDNKSDDEICVNIKEVNELSNYKLINVPKGIYSIYEVTSYFSWKRQPKYYFRIFKYSTIKEQNRTEKELIDNNIYDALYVYTYDQLKAMNFTITYTGE